MTDTMSLPPPTTAEREYALELEPPRRRGTPGLMKLSSMGAVIEFESALHTPLVLPLGTLQLGLVEFGSGGDGRFPILKRLSPDVVVPRKRGVEGWLWTRPGGSALTVLGEPSDTPNAALLFTKPLGDEAVACFQPESAQEIAARSPLGAPAIHGLLFRVAEPLEAETVFRRFGLLRQLTDREVPPTLRRSLPSDRPAGPPAPASRDETRAASSVAPPGFG